jgi:hypothetical protein
MIEEEYYYCDRCNVWGFNTLAELIQHNFKCIQITRQPWSD